MQYYEDSTLSISHRAYLISASLRRITKVLFAMYFFAITPYVVDMIWSAYTNPRGTVSFAGTLILVVPTPFVVWCFYRSRLYFRNFDDWRQEYLEQAYILIFGTTLPQGNTTGEKVLSLARQIFPELRQDYLKLSPDFVHYIKWRFKKKFG